MRLLWIMLAGALGAAARYGLTLALQGWLKERGASTSLGSFLGSDFPLGTLLINVLGALLLSFLVALVQSGIADPELRPILGAGFLGAFTTFSTFALETEDLIARGLWKQASVYVLGNLVLGYLAIFAGRALALRMVTGNSGSGA